jgi:signal transduction histidine kinase
MKSRPGRSVSRARTPHAPVRGSRVKQRGSRVDMQRRASRNNGGDVVSTPPTTLPESGSAGRGNTRRWIPRLHDARIRSKLALILVVPVAAVVALAGARLIESGQRAADASLVRELTALATDVSALAHETHEERMAAARLLDAPGLQDPSIYNAQARRTDERIAAYNAARKALGDVPNTVESRLARIDEHLTTLNGTRQDVISNEQVSVSEAILRYGVIITDLVSYGEVIGQIAGEGELADSLRALAAFANAKAATAEEQAVGYAALSAGGRLDEEQFSAFVATLTSQQEALLSFSLAASGTQQELVNSTVTGDAVILADRAANEISRSVGQRSAITADAAARSIGAVNDLMRFAERRLEGQALADADAVRGDVIRQVLIESILVLITLVIAVTLAVVLARSLVFALTRLREGALSVANHDLPDAVARLRDVRSLGEGGVDAVTRQVRDPIRLPGRDEVGQVAQAFNVVHREAVRVAAEQAALRTSVSAMFLNLARRSQALVDRMIGELDNIERTEEDPKRLAQLFQLDHLATRMRRNDENLLVLAGADSAAPRREDALLIDAVRAAQSEVELYNRIEFGTVDSDISIAAHAVNDVVRLLAELLDNATRFSPPNTIVVAEARRIRDYVLIQVEDRGLGISDEQLETLNRRLAEPPPVDVDVAAFRLMGLAVVARLAARYGIRVELRHNTGGGTVAHVSLPSTILILPQHRGRDVLASPRAPRAVETGPFTAELPVTGNGHAGWTDGGKPALPTRSPAATLTDDPWAASPSRWDAPMEPLPLGGQATAAYPTTSSAAQGAPHATGYGVDDSAAYATTGAMASPTVATPTVAAAPRADASRAEASRAEASRAEASRVDGSRAEEMPIFREMEASWFRAHSPANLEPWAMPTAGHQPPPSPVAATSGAAEQRPASMGINGYAATSASAGPAATATGYASAAPTSAAPTSASPAPTSAAPSGAPASPAAPRTSFGHRPGGSTGSVPGGSASGGTAPGGTASSGDVPRPAAHPLPPQGYAPPEVPSRTATVPSPRTSAENSWQTSADDGWRRASEAAVPMPAGTTRSGLPKRVPQAQLVPGGVEPTSGRERSRRTPEEVRGLLSAYHRGVQRGRLASGEGGDAPRTQTKETNR